ncbi:hypothetical protein [Bacillus suaedaesalsae]|uniref:Uncharacterized protein n=1 Tax=Bacillus suaedaesalsae TaxID=2810349 RepID=A0ABS2DH00_9BACI|nr:hypothetical protein [Bacillus suaedaesalsae]MBM6617733.1 hypothetical protein [Bacillus suaedaesalsae]
MDKKENRQQNKKTKSFQELSQEIQENPNLKNAQPTLNPDDFEEIEY